MKIGIITMHKVLNCGSALQAYALQKKIQELGYNSEIIDYEYPYSEKSSLQDILFKIRLYFAWFRGYHPVYFRFLYFWRKYFKLSFRKYTKKSIIKKCPQYNIYISGSDQIWNPRFTDGDTNFLLAFAPECAPRLSYASSFTSSTIPDEYKKSFASELTKYDKILVREKSGAGIVKELIGNEAEVVLDPTLLLKENDYLPIGNNSKIRIEEPYILVYILNYMFDPFPEINQIVESVKNELNIKVVYIGKTNFVTEDKTHLFIKKVGPCEFLWLFSHASFVITTSFHGTAFAVINHKPLLSVVQSRDSYDGRIHTLLNSINQQESIIDCKDIPSREIITSDKIISREEYIEPVRNHSINLLTSMLEPYGK